METDTSLVCVHETYIQVCKIRPVHTKEGELQLCPRPTTLDGEHANHYPTDAVYIIGQNVGHHKTQTNVNKT
jgi:hypothetical protein